MVESVFRFQPPYLTAVDFDINPSILPQDASAYPVSIFLQTDINRNEEGQDAKVEITVKSNYNDKGEREANAPFWITVSYASKFMWDDSLSDDMIDAMLHVNAPSVLLSYVRPLISQLTSSSPFPTYDLPFLNLSKMWEEARNAK